MLKKEDKKHPKNGKMKRIQSSVSFQNVKNVAIQWHSFSIYYRIILKRKLKVFTADKNQDETKLQEFIAPIRKTLVAF